MGRYECRENEIHARYCICFPVIYEVIQLLEQNNLGTNQINQNDRNLLHHQLSLGSEFMIVDVSFETVKRNEYITKVIEV